MGTFWWKRNIEVSMLCKSTKFLPYCVSGQGTEYAWFNTNVVQLLYMRSFPELPVCLYGGHYDQWGYDRFLVQVRLRQKYYALQVWLQVWHNLGSNPWHSNHRQYISCPWDTCLNHWTIKGLWYICNVYKWTILGYPLCIMKHWCCQARLLAWVDLLTVTVA